MSSIKLQFNYTLKYISIYLPTHLSIYLHKIPSIWEILVFSEMYAWWIYWAPLVIKYQNTIHICFVCIPQHSVPAVCGPILSFQMSNTWSCLSPGLARLLLGFDLQMWYNFWVLGKLYTLTAKLHLRKKINQNSSAEICFRKSNTICLFVFHFKKLSRRTLN